MGQKIIKNSKQVYFFQLNKIKNVPKYLVIEDLKKKSLKISSRSRELVSSRGISVSSHP